MSGRFLVEYPELWNGREGYQIAAAITKTQTVTNDHVERRVALIQDAAKSGHYRSEEQLQYALQVIEQNRALFPNIKKPMLL